LVKPNLPLLRLLDLHISKRRAEKRSAFRRFRATIGRMMLRSSSIGDSGRKSKTSALAFSR
jgi:hypothetical protein